MSPGKLAAQAFQACQRLYLAAEHEPELREKLEQWQREGTRTCTRAAKTTHLFERAARELPCAVMVDEGLTEVEPGTATCLATWPLRRSEQPPYASSQRLARDERRRLATRGTPQELVVACEAA